MIEVNNLTKTLVDKKLLEDIGQEIFKKEGIRREADVSVALVGESKIKEINRVYRGKDEATDVLSFQEGPEFILPPGDNDYLGQIIICPSKAKAKDGITRVFIHGLLHLMGFEHKSQKNGRIMEGKEKEYLNLFLKKK